MSPKKMTAVEIVSPGPPDVLVPRQIARPIAHPNEVLIKIGAAGVNRPDILQRLGLYPVPKGASPLPGLEVAGTIEQVGINVSRFKPGEKVVALTNGGGYAEFVSVPAGQVLPLPDNWSMIEGAALPETLFTVQQTLIDRAGLKKGQMVLVHGGASGIGGTAIQLARLKGAIPFVTVSSGKKADYATSLGAKASINYLTEDFVARIKELTAGAGVEIILDIVGGDYLDRNLKAIAIEGTIIQLAMIAGNQASINLALLLARRANLFGSTLRPQPDQIKAQIADHLYQQVWPALKSGDFKKPRIITFELANAKDAHKAMLSPDHFGKIVLTV
ncbi:Quinone oxidoreductase [hydrothermal vent metagenome]|uniref:Quinone oxidoreductase n=1 Tax=hydrothermal vent metagenome TaxID=652676 RepID=A0A3B0TAZ2_9ZZZZ